MRPAAAAAIVQEQFLVAVSLDDQQAV